MTVIYQLRSESYFAWTEAERNTIHRFLEAHEIDRSDVLVTNGGDIEVREREDGALELTVWVVDKENGKSVKCPTCPSCIRQKLVTRKLKTPLPKVSLAYVAEGYTAIGVAS